MITTRLQLIVGYKGTRFDGWASGRPDSVHHRLESAIGEYLSVRSEASGLNVRLEGSSRTDRGVHALANSCHVDIGWPTEDANAASWASRLVPSAFFAGVNAKLCARRLDARIMRVTPRPADWHCRFSAIGRTYVYRMVLDQALRPTPFGQDQIWCVPESKRSKDYGWDVEAMQKACAMFEGTHDFSSFRSAGCQSVSPIRNIYSMRLNAVAPPHWHALSQTLADRAAPPVFLELVVHGRAFLYHQVRNMVGALVQVGLSVISLEQLAELFAARNRSLAPALAPAHGLFLADVHYPDTPADLADSWPPPRRDP